MFGSDKVQHMTRDFDIWCILIDLGTFQIPDAAGSFLDVIGCQESARAANALHMILRLVSTCLASSLPHVVLPGRSSLLAVGCIIITSYVACTVQRALPAVTKVDC